MEKILFQVLKTVIFYILGFMLLYPLSLLALLPGLTGFSLYFTQLLVMGAFCFLMGRVIAIWRSSSACQNKVPACKKLDLIIQWTTVFVIFAFVIVKEKNQIYYLNRNLYGFFRMLCFGNETMARTMYTGPVLNLPYFVQIFTGWILFKAGSKSLHR